MPILIMKGRVKRVQVYSNNKTGTAVTLNDPISFTTNAIETGCTATANQPATAISLNKAGLYMVHFNDVIAQTTTVTPDFTNAASSVSGFVSVTMLNNCIPVAEAKTCAVTGADIPMVMSFDTIVMVRPGCASIGNTASLSFNIVGNNALVYQENVTVTKLA